MKSHYLKNRIQIAKDIKDSYASFDGFVILHGTDTMAFGASALSFMLEHLGKPVIVTGSQIPCFETRSDGRDNFVGALILAGNYHIPEVCVYFRHQLMRGNRTIKVSASDLDAFQSPNVRYRVQNFFRVRALIFILNFRCNLWFVLELILRLITELFTSTYVVHT